MVEEEIQSKHPIETVAGHAPTSEVGFTFKYEMVTVCLSKSLETKAKEKSEISDGLQERLAHCSSSVLDLSFLPIRYSGKSMWTL